MADQTPNLGLVKPVPSDQFNLSNHFNANWSGIDDGVNAIATLDEIQTGAVTDPRRITPSVLKEAIDSIGGVNVTVVNNWNTLIPPAKGTAGVQFFQSPPGATDTITGDPGSGGIFAYGFWAYNDQAIGNTYTLFAVGADNTLWTRTYHGGWWSWVKMSDTGTSGVSSGGTADIVVAATDSSTIDKARANYVMTGTTDTDAGALNSLISSRSAKSVFFCPGNYSFPDYWASSLTPSNIRLFGSSPVNTIIDNLFPITNCLIENLGVGYIGNAVSSATKNTIANCQIGSMVSGAEYIIQNCRFIASSKAIVAYIAVYGPSVKILNCYFPSRTSSLVIQAITTTSTATDLLIFGCTFDYTNSHSILISSNLPNIKIINNTFNSSVPDLTNYCDIYINGSVSGLIVKGNHSSSRRFLWSVDSTYSLTNIIVENNITSGSYGTASLVLYGALTGVQIIGNNFSQFFKLYSRSTSKSIQILNNIAPGFKMMTSSGTTGTRAYACQIMHNRFTEAGETATLYDSYTEVHVDYSYVMYNIGAGTITISTGTGNTITPNITGRL